MIMIMGLRSISASKEVIAMDLKPIIIIIRQSQQAVLPTVLLLRFEVYKLLG